MKNRFLSYAVIILGLTSVISQIVLMRELISVFYGNELAIGTFLGAWLLWTAVGSFYLPKIIHSQNFSLSIGILQWSVCIILPASLYLIKLSPPIIGAVTGEMIGYLPMLTITIISLAPFCLINGALYTLSCRQFETLLSDASSSIKSAYFLEALGSGIGGLVMGYFLLRWIQPTQILHLLVVLNFFSGMMIGNINPFHHPFYRRVWIMCMILVSVSLGLYLAPIYQHLCNKKQWQGYHIVSTHQSIYGNIVITKIKEQFSFFQNGVLLFSIPDKLTNEESVHYALLEHPNPKSVLLIGGGMGGSIQEAQKHPSLETIAYVELDPLLVNLAMDIADSIRLEPDVKPVTTIYYSDGRHFIKTTDMQFDVVILNLPNPYSAQLNRFYTIEFYREIKKILVPGGLISVQLPSSENAISPELSAYLSAIQSTLKTVFDDVIALPGETTRFFAADRAGILTVDSDILIKRLQDRNLNTIYVREYFIPYIFSEERQRTLNERLYPVAKNHLNKDFKPIGYYFDTILWATTYSKSFKSIFQFLSQIRFQNLIGFLMVLTIGILIILKYFIRPVALKQFGVHFSIWSIGFTEISLEIIVILVFQILYGYVYHFVAVVIAGYMAGLALGSGVSFSPLIQRYKSIALFRKLQLSMALYPLLLAGLFFLFHQYSMGKNHFLWIKWFFPVLTLLAGFIGGLQFPIANQILIQLGKPLHRVAGKMLALDLTGSSCGAFLTTAFLIPILGIHPVLILLSVFNLCGFIILKFSK